MDTTDHRAPMGERRLLSGARLLRAALGTILVVAAATVGAALIAEQVFGLVPCKLCLLERRPYYAAIPVAMLGLALPSRGPWLRLALGVLALVFLGGAALGAYHAGAEWGFWPGPTDCGGGSGPPPPGVGDFLKSLDRARIVSCTEASWRFAGLSLAGWNTVVSAALAGLAALAAVRQGSSSVSQYR